MRVVGLQKEEPLHRDALLAGIILLQILTTSCRQNPPKKVPPSQEGHQLQVPVSNPFPRPGMQWSYKVSHRGFTAPIVIPDSISYRYLYSDNKKRLWTNLFYYNDRPEPSDGTFEQIEPGYVFTHPPRSRQFGFRDLEKAPFPIATPGRAGTQKRQLELGPGWEPYVGEVIEQSYTDHGPCQIRVPAGMFQNAWCVTGKTKEWTAQFWWVEHVGWVRMSFQCIDGRSLDLQLDQVRQTTDFSDP